jgi:hypothetical protein
VQSGAGRRLRLSLVDLALAAVATALWATSFIGGLQLLGLAHRIAAGDLYCVGLAFSALGWARISLGLLPVAVGLSTLRFPSARQVQVLLILFGLLWTIVLSCPLEISAARALDRSLVRQADGAGEDLRAWAKAKGGFPADDAGLREALASRLGQPSPFIRGAARTRIPFTAVLIPAASGPWVQAPRTGQPGAFHLAVSVDRRRAWLTTAGLPISFVRFAPDNAGHDLEVAVGREPVLIRKTPSDLGPYIVDLELSPPGAVQ